MANERKRRRPPVEQQPKRPPAQEVVYTAPEPLNRKKFILRLATVAAVVIALFIGCSIFFKVEKITVSGNMKYDAWTVSEASGIKIGDSLLAFGKAKACGRISEQLPYVKIVRIGITLPNTVNIHVEELDVVYAAQDENDSWWLLTSGGRIVESASGSYAQKHTLLKGFRILEPVVGENAQAVEIDPETTPSGEEPPIITITNKDRLDTALTIVYELERKGILGKAASVDVTGMGNIELWYGTDYQVLLGDPGEMENKIALMHATLQRHEKEGSYQSGILDISFTTYPGAVGYTPWTDEKK
jgi:cell division protein FtsQ